MSDFKKFNKEFKQLRHNNSEEVRFESGMTSEQKFNAISESVLANINPLRQTLKGCSMHPKISKKCRKCQQIEANIEKIEKEEIIELDQRFPEMIKINTNNTKSHFSQKLQKNVEDAQFYKTKLKSINNVRELVNDLTSDQISIDAYIGASTDTPTPFFCYFYRLAELRPTKEQTTIMLRANNVNVRCLALLYLRTYADPTLVYGCLSNSFKDNKLLSTITIGEYAMRLLDQEQLNHGGFRLPRLPIKYQRAIDLKIAKIKADREREFEKQRNFENERERSREKERKRREYEQQEYQAKKKQEEQVQFGVFRAEQANSQGNRVDVVPTSLKEKIRLMEQKKAVELRKKAMLEIYKSQNIDKLQSEEQAYDENDQIEKFKVG